MNRYAVMVDAGYLLRQAIEIVSAKASRRRVDLHISDPDGLMQLLVAKSCAMLDLSGKELLRIYWYDGVNTNGHTAQQRTIMNVDDVQFRAGTVNSAGQQKGVDSLIVTDLLELASHHAITDAILVTGDSDLAIGVELTQRRGVRIAVLGVEDLAQGVAHHQSFEITSRADRVARLGGNELAPFFQYRPQPLAQPTARTAPAVPQGTAAPAAQPTAVTAAQAAAPAAQATVTPAAQAAIRPIQTRAQTATIDAAALDSVIDQFVAQGKDTLRNAVDRSTSSIKHAVDAALMRTLVAHFAVQQLTAAQKIDARRIFREKVARAFPIQVGLPAVAPGTVAPASTSAPGSNVGSSRSQQSE